MFGKSSNSSTNGHDTKHALLRRSDLPIPRYSPKWWLTLPSRLGVAWRRLSPKDTQFLEVSYWWYGKLDRIPIEQFAANACEDEIVLVNPGRRTPGTSVNLHEIVCLLMALHSVRRRRVLEIGTFDGNTALNLASNLPEDGQVVTIDLPAEFSEDDRLEVSIAASDRNVTNRKVLASQYRGHPLESRIRQIYSDSAKVNFAELGRFDMAFLDGCHAPEYVRLDTENALRVFAGGMLVWHDYPNIAGVASVVDSFQSDPRVERMCAIEGSRLAMGRLKG